MIDRSSTLTITTKPYLLLLNIAAKKNIKLMMSYISARGSHGCDHMVVGFTTTCAISAYHITTGVTN
jgi:hypothetical protein